MARGRAGRNLEEEMSKALIEEIRMLREEVKALRRLVVHVPSPEDPVHVTRFVGSRETVAILGRRKAA